MKKVFVLVSLMFSITRIDLFAQQQGMCMELPPIFLRDSLAGQVSNRMSCPDYQIILDFNQNVAQPFRDVIQYAANEWSALLNNSDFHSCNYPVVVLMSSSLPSGVLASTQRSINQDGELIGATLAIQSTNTWFLDQSPQGDDEFQSNSPPIGYDLLSVMRHELGHVVGWTATSHVTNLLSNSVFDEDKLNIAFDAVSNHTDANFHVNDLMNPTIGVSERRAISLYPDVAMVSKAYHYGVTNLRAAESGGGISNSGAVYEPFGVMLRAFEQFSSPPNSTLILMPGTITSVIPVVRDKPMIIMAPRGKIAIIE
jgi:hypothetical protein